jgi:hypothetical protein
MITSLVKSTVRITAGGIRLVSRYSLWLTRTIASTAFKPPHRERRLEPEMSSEWTTPPSASTVEPPTRPADRGVPGRDVPPARPTEPHHTLNAPVSEPDPTEWPDPYDQRPDPRDPDSEGPVPIGTVPHTPTGARSTSAPHPADDPEAEPWEAPKRDRVDE